MEKERLARQKRLRPDTSTTSNGDDEDDDDELREPPAQRQQISRFQQGVEKVNGGGAIKKTVFNGAFTAKKANVPVIAQSADSVVLSSIHTATGGRLRIAPSGGAAISRKTQEFLSTALVTVLQ
ncbi:hypothetical protein C0995_005395, partial [Termitomyces sp. Mi166